MNEEPQEPQEVTPREAFMIGVVFGVLIGVLFLNFLTLYIVK